VAPEAPLLGLPDGTGRLRVAGRTSPLALPARHETRHAADATPAHSSVAGPNPGVASTSAVGATRQPWRGCEQSWIRWTFHRRAATTS